MKKPRALAVVVSATIGALLAAGAAGALTTPTAHSIDPLPIPEAQQTVSTHR